MINRIVIFSHYDKQNIIDPYVISYLKELKKYSDIIFVSDNELDKNEKNKIKDLCFDIIAKNHNEYDFGSYKRGFQLLQKKYSQKLQKINELLFVNDSCYLVGSLAKIFIEIERNNKVDCWGLTDDYFGHKDYFIGSYFLVFKKSVFLEDFFSDFMHNIKTQKNKIDIIINYEIGLSKLLIKNNKKIFAIFGLKRIINLLSENFIEISNDISKIVAKNSYLSKKKSLKLVKNIFNIYIVNYLHSNKFYLFLCCDFPLFKRSLIDFKSFSKEVLLFFWEEILEKFYPDQIDQIKLHCKRIDFKTKSKKIYYSKINYLSYRLRLVKFFYIKKYKEEGKNLIMIKFLFFKIKYYRKI